MKSRKQLSRKKEDAYEKPKVNKIKFLDSNEKIGAAGLSGGKCSCDCMTCSCACTCY